MVTRSLEIQRLVVEEPQTWYNREPRVVTPCCRRSDARCVEQLDPMLRAQLAGAAGVLARNGVAPLPSGAYLVYAFGTDEIGVGHRRRAASVRRIASARRRRDRRVDRHVAELVRNAGAEIEAVRRERARETAALIARNRRAFDTMPPQVQAIVASMRSRRF